MSVKEYIITRDLGTEPIADASVTQDIKLKVNASGIFTMEEAANLLHVNCAYLHELTHLKEDPFPARILYWKKQGLFVLADELFDWVKRNAPLRDERRDFKRDTERTKK